MLTMRPQEGSATADPAGADQARIMGEAVALAFERGGGKLSGMSRDALASDLAGILEPLLNTCTNAEWIEAVNARLNRLECETSEPGPRLERFTLNGSAEMTTPLR
ncbi:hypothetical protein ACRBEV_32385 [Methylobacterium phyllosphaerae]